MTRKKTSSGPASRRSTRAGATDRRALRTRAKKIITLLQKEYPTVECPLDHSTPLQLLVATILSAQCTDVRVNQVTPGLFKKYTCVEEWAGADQTELEEEIKSTGFFRNKAKAIRNCCQELIDRFDGNIPDSMDELSSLPGVGRKTANVILGYAFGRPAIMVDTHMKRVAGRLQLTRESDPVKIEFDLMELVPERDRTGFSHGVLQHGRRICNARKPLCSECFLFKYCPFPSK